MDRAKSLTVRHISEDITVNDLRSRFWDEAKPVVIDRYWCGETASEGRQFEARLLWSDTALFVRFAARQTEPLVIAEDPQVSEKTMNLWERDVCEIFIAPDADEPEHYFEFEVAPTGEWLDIEIRLGADGRKSNWEFDSGMAAAASIDDGLITSALKVDWKALDVQPKPGDIMRGNLFRCVGRAPDRGYLAWCPTETPTPNFHVPDMFGTFRFV